VSSARAGGVVSGGATQSACDRLGVSGAHPGTQPEVRTGRAFPASPAPMTHVAPPMGAPALIAKAAKSTRSGGPATGVELSPAGQAASPAIAGTLHQPAHFAFHAPNRGLFV
jgi:hypothetical protein